MLAPRLSVWIAALWLTIASADLAAQVQNEFDFDTTQLAVTTIPPNGATHTITGLVTYTGQNLALNAPLLVSAGAELRIVRSVLKVFGNVTIADGGRLTVIDSSLLVPCTFQRQYEFRCEGGLLHTERALIGSTPNPTTLYITRFLHLRGTWLARETVVQALVTILSDGRTGWFGDLRYKGGAVFGKSMWEGDRADAIHTSGMGDVQLIDGTMNVGFYYDAAASTTAASATVDLDARSRLNVTYGDPLVHQGVTVPLTRHPCRIQLVNHRSAGWQFFAVNASSAGPLQTLTLRNCEDIICNFRGIDLIGSPVLGGPWASHYSQLPGLPSTARPGFHSMPPGCSVRLGNVQFQSGPGVNDWNRIRSWGIYARGFSTNLVVNGPTLLAELQLTDGVMSLSGTGSYDMGVFANTVRLYQTANLQINNASLGEFGVGSGTVGLIEANNSSTCTISNSRAAIVRLKPTAATASITGTNVFGRENLILDNAAGGTLQIAQATTTQTWDLQNLGFESPLLAGNVPPYWAASSVTGSLVADAAPGASGTNAYAFVAQAANASLQKSLTVSPETFISMVGAAKVVTAPGGGATVSMQTSQGATVRTKTLDLTQLNAWKRVHVPLLLTGAGGGAVLPRFVASATPATVRLDDLRVLLGSWWDNDNLGNLDFEMGCRFQGVAPNYSSAPDAWRSFQVSCVPAVGNVRPGSSGAQSMQLTLQSTSGSIYKELNFLRATDVVEVRGWCRGVSANPGASMQFIAGNGANYHVVGLGNNVHSGPIPCNGTWIPFLITYVVPSNPSYTRIDLGLYDVGGTQCWFDDITVDIR